MDARCCARISLSDLFFCETVTVTVAVAVSLPHAILWIKTFLLKVSRVLKPPVNTQHQPLHATTAILFCAWRVTMGGVSSLELTNYLPLLEDTVTPQQER